MAINLTDPEFDPSSVTPTATSSGGLAVPGDSSQNSQMQQALTNENLSSAQQAYESLPGAGQSGLVFPTTQTDIQYDIQQLNNQADQYAISGATDPQAFAELAPIGGAGSVGSSFGQSSAVSKRLQALPASAAPVYNPTALNLSAQNLQSLQTGGQPVQFNTQQYIQSTQKDIQENKNNDGQWKSLGEIPTANEGYVQQLVNSTDSKRVSSWQTFLISKGYASGLQASGSWSGQSQSQWMSSLQNYFVSRFTPDALWSKNPVAQESANNFLKSTFGYDVSKLPNQQSDTFRNTVLTQYIMSAGQDTSDKDTLQEVVSNYGYGVLSKAYQSIMNPGILGDIEGGVHDLFTMGATMGAAALGQAIIPIPVLGGLIGGAVGGLLTQDLVDPLLNHLGPVGQAIGTGTTTLSGQLLQGVDPSTVAAINDINDQVVQNSGFMGLFNAAQMKVNQVLITARYFLAGNVGEQFKTSDQFNVWDDWQTASQSASNPMDGIFGHNWATENPILNAVGNFMINTFGNPLMYVGGVVRGAETDVGAALDAYKEGEAQGLTGQDLYEYAANAGTKSKGFTMGAMASRKYLMRPVVMRDRMSQPYQGLMDVAMNPVRTSASEVLKTLMDTKTTAAQASKMLGVNETFWPQLLKAKQSGDPMQMLYFLHDTGLDTKVADPSNLAIVSEAQKVFQPGQIGRLGLGRISALLDPRIRGQNYFNDSMLNNLSKTQQLDAMRMALQVHGASTEQMNEILEDFMSGVPTDKIGTKIESIYNENLKNGTLPEDLEKKIAQLKSGRLQVDVAGRNITVLKGKTQIPNAAGHGRFYHPILDKNGKVAEGSTVYSKWTFSDPADQKVADTLRAALDTNRDLMDAYQRQSVASYKQHVDPQNVMNMSDDQALAALENDPTYNAEISKFQQKAADKISAMQSLPSRKGVEGETRVAAFSSQFANAIHFPQNPYDILMAMNPRMQQIEGLQRALPLDQINSLWRSAVVANIHDALKIPFSDDSARLYAKHIMHSPIRGLKAFSSGIQKMIDQGKITDVYNAPGIERISAHLNDLIRTGQDDYTAIMEDDPAYAGERGLYRHITRTLGESEEAQVWAKAKAAGPQRTQAKVRGKIKTKAVTANEHAINALANWLKGEDVEDTWGFGDEIKYLQDRAKNETGADLANTQKEIRDRQAKMTNRSSKAQEFVNRAGPKFDVTNVEHRMAWARQKHDQLMQSTGYKASDQADDQFLFNALLAKANGEKVPTVKEFEKFAQRNQGTGRLIPIVGYRPMGAEHSLLNNGFGFKKGMNWFSQKTTAAMVNRARQKHYDFMYDEYTKEISKSRPDLSEDAVAQLAQNEAEQFITRNTYQFQRTMTGHALRNAYPFWGATASMDKFMVRQAVENPLYGSAAVNAINDIQQAHQEGKLNLKIPMSGWMLQHMGMSNADDITWDPSSAIYFGNYGGFAPSIGPFIMDPLNEAANMDPNIAATIEGDPILSRLIDTQYLGSQGAVLPWLGKAIQGTEMMLGQNPSNIPFLTGGNYQSKQAAITQEQIANADQTIAQGGNAQMPTSASVNRQLGAETLVGDVASFVAPGTSTFQDRMRNDIQTFQNNLDNATTDQQKQSIMEQAANVQGFGKGGIAPLLAYRDASLAQYLPGGAPIDSTTGYPLTSSQLGDWLIGEYPWLSAYAGKVTTTQSTADYSAAPLSTFDQYLNDGTITYLNTPDIVQNAQNQVQSSAGWLQWQRANDMYQQALLSYNTTSSTTIGQELKAQIMTPVEQQLAQDNPTFWSQFTKGGGSSDPGQAGMPLNTAAVWNSLPGAAGNSTATTDAWRQMMVWRQQLGGELAQAIQEYQPSTYKDQLINQFLTKVANLTEDNPQFAQEIGRYTYKDVSDILNAYAYGDY